MNIEHQKRKLPSTQDKGKALDYILDRLISVVNPHGSKMAASVCTTRVLNLPGIKQFLGIVDRLGKTGRSFSD